ncbi:cathepsin L-like [Oppia nitens]|uniref:cathepsin L-like n=1 Tax=Oppia nitens TaxID=1686743 RepID=UPI0023DBAB3B|nr:cathepsin L-like [Oppia nitens]
MSDMTLEEIKKHKLGLIKDKPKEKMLKSSLESNDNTTNTNIPIEWDWRKYGIVTPARHQDTCGCCWSFASIATLESHLMKVQISDGKFDPKNQLTLSEQNLIDCSASFGTLGCDGGSTRMAFEYVQKIKGLNNVKDYPYINKPVDCKYNKEKRIDLDIKDIIRIDSGDDEELATVIYKHGPVSVGIHATPMFYKYKNGIFNDVECNASDINHAVVAVGYDPDYFIIKNSWGTHWGEDGYIRVSRSKTNNCGVSEQCYYPLLANDITTDKIKDKLIKKI